MNHNRSAAEMGELPFKKNESNHADFTDEI
jgi:hypothetical protein